MGKKFLKIVLYISGIFCILYPMYAKFLSYKNQTITIYDYEKELSMMKEEELKRKIKDAEEFNTENSLESEIINTNDVNTEDEVKSSYNFLKLGEMLGYIKIPKVNIELPIYEGVTEDNLLMGVAHMENSSLPNGDLNTHSVLAGHTGISTSIIFDNIDKLEVNDEFYIDFYGNTNKYKVIYKTIVFPSQTESLNIQKDRCLVTLVTCTPKSVNTKRLLVTAEKVNEISNENLNETIDNNLHENKKSNFQLFKEFIKTNNIIYIIIIVVILLFLIFTFIIYIVKKIKNKKKNKNEKS